MGMGWGFEISEAQHHIKATTTSTTTIILSSINRSTSKPPTMPSNVLSTMAARAKAHHESMNAAYQATYSMGTSTHSTPSTSRKSSTTSVDQHSERNITKAWKALKKHHQEMNEAYTVFYSQGMVTPASSSRASSVAQTPKASFEEKRMSVEEQKPRNIEKAWKAIKNRAVEHHRSVNNASAAVYGA